MPRPVLLAVDGDPAAKRRFHGPGRSPRRHLGFVVVHVQPFALALVVPGFGWTAAAAVAWFAPVLPIKLLLPGEAAPRGGT
jgi:hypothetical protein